MKFVLQLPSSELMRTMAHFGAKLQFYSGGTLKPFAQDCKTDLEL